MGIAQLAGEQLKPYVAALIPRLYRYQHDPNAGVREAMTRIWQALVPDDRWGSGARGKPGHLHAASQSQLAAPMCDAAHLAGAHSRQLRKPGHHSCTTRGLPACVALQDTVAAATGLAAAVRSPALGCQPGPCAAGRPWRSTWTQSPRSW